MIRVRLMSIILLLIVPLLCACQPLSAPVSVPASRLEEATVAQIEGIVDQAMIDDPIPGFALCIVWDGQVVYSEGFGLADLEEKRPVTPQSLLMQGSVTKSFTAMAVLRLAEQGLIDLDAPVTDYLPYFSMADERYREITVRMLLSHRAGLPDSPDFWQEPLDTAMNPLEQAVRDLNELTLLFAPDTGWSYSSYGYSALGAIIAAVTGQPFERYMQEEWLEPLGMVRSTFVPEDVDPALAMTLYNGYKIDRLNTTMPQTDGRDASAGNLWSSCEEMVLWAQLLLNDGEANGVRFLQPESIEAMWTPLSSTGWMLGPSYGPAFEHYGLGWFVGEKEGHRLVGHMGAGDGINAQILLTPDNGLAVVAMDNWMDLRAATGYPASWANIDVMDLLLALEE